MTGIALILTGIAILAFSLPPLYALIGLLPTSSLRRYWYALMLLVSFFIAGYISYGIIFWEHILKGDLHDLVVPIIFFSGSCFVWVTSTLFHRTTLDLRRMELLEEESITDPLIHIYNRRYLDRRLANEIALAKRHGLQLSILMVDIDHFKAINDDYGHQAGDLVLSYLGELILKAIRQSDIAARYGGEEFVIIAPEADSVAAADLAERLRESVEEHELVLASADSEAKIIRINVSIGVAELNEEIKTAEQLLDISDVAMYQAKAAGRNRVRVYQSEHY